MKKRQLLLINFILLVSILNVNDFVKADTRLPELSSTKIEQSINDIETKDETKDKDKLIKDNKKTLKKELQNRKKYHKNLVSFYNLNFDNNYLELIKDNSLKIQYLENLI
ncbi:MAG: hypothetical protein PHE25_03960 [Candidatus Gracilibacteria bacterium]|nr:hypothetical protein [Candidatus Gracilibacteria bacterium]